MASTSFHQFGISDDFYESEINPARPGAATTLLSLPFELLLEITQYAKFADVYTLTTVNRRLHAVSITRFYSLVAVNATKFLRRLATACPGITAHSSVHDMVPFFTCPSSSILRGLFARDHHLHSLRTLILCNSPGESKETEFRLLCTILQYIVDRATGLTSLNLPGAGYMLGMDPLRQTTPVRLTGIQSATQIHTLRILELSSYVSDAIVQYMPSLKELHTSNVTLEFLRTPEPARIYSRIVKFSCTWIIDADPKNFDLNAALHRDLPRIMPNLRHLSIEYASWEYQLRYQHAALTEQILESCYALVQSLSTLEHFEMPKFTEATYGWRGSEVLNEEVHMLQRFAALGPGLKRVTIRNHNPLALFNIHYTHEPSVTWKRATCFPEDDGNRTPFRVPAWTPNPATVSRWWWWVGVFGDVKVMHRVMVREWKGDGEIPSLDDLEQWASNNRRIINNHLHIY